MTVRDTSLEAFENNRQRLEHDEQIVYEAIDDLGPCCDKRILEYLLQAESLKPRDRRKCWEINQVTGRRNSLFNKNYIWDMGKFSGCWYGRKKTYHFWKIPGDARDVPAGWVKVEAQQEYSPRPVMSSQRAMQVSEAASILARCRKSPVRRRGRNSNQLTFI